MMYLVNFSTSNHFLELINVFQQNLIIGDEQTNQQGGVNQQEEEGNGARSSNSYMALQVCIIHGF